LVIGGVLKQVLGGFLSIYSEITATLFFCLSFD